MDYGNSKSAAIAEFCRSCMVTHGSVSDCPCVGCPLFPFRPGADAAGATARRPGIDIPTKEWYEEELRKRDPDGAKAGAARERFAASRKAGNVSEPDEGEEGPDTGTEDTDLEW